MATEAVSHAAAVDTEGLLRRPTEGSATHVTEGCVHALQTVDGLKMQGAQTWTGITDALPQKATTATAATSTTLPHATPTLLHATEATPTLLRATTIPTPAATLLPHARAAGGDALVPQSYRFLYLGPAGSFTGFHCDVLRSYSWSANIAGRKRWVLYPPGQEQFLQDSRGNMITDLALLETVGLFVCWSKVGVELRGHRLSDVSEIRF
jgi:hypothetical protein